MGGWGVGGVVGGKGVVVVCENGGCVVGRNGC